MAKIRNAQRLRVISKDACFFTNAKQVRDGVGTDAKFNISVDSALNKLEELGAESVCAVFAGFQIQIDLWGDHAVKFPQVGKSVF
jgi:hypothetical protein